MAAAPRAAGNWQFVSPARVLLSPGPRRAGDGGVHKGRPAGELGAATGVWGVWPGQARRGSDRGARPSLRRWQEPPGRLGEVRRGPSGLSAPWGGGAALA